MNVGTMMVLVPTADAEDGQDEMSAGLEWSAMRAIARTGLLPKLRCWLPKWRWDSLAYSSRAEDEHPGGMQKDKMMMASNACPSRSPM